MSEIVYVPPGQIITDDHAHQTVQYFWDRTHPKPLTPLPKIQNIAKRALIAGYTPEEIVRALNQCRAFTIPAVEYQLRSSFIPNYGRNAERVLRMME